MSLWKRIFRRDTPPPPPTPEEPKLNEDWAPGDQALCIMEFRDWPMKMPVVDEVYIVRDVEIGFLSGLDADGNWVQDRTRKQFGLSLRGLDPNAYWNCTGFRKIIPHKDEETTDIGVSEMIKRCAPAPEKVG